MAVGKVAYKVSGVQSIVSCVTDPGLSSCLQAALTVALVVGTAGSGEIADIAAEGALDAAEDAGAAAAENAGSAAAEDAAGAGGARIPFGSGTEKAWSVLNRALGKGSPFPGFKGGSIFKNLEGRLPELDSGGNPIKYTEWDVNPFIKGVNRGPERVVTGSDGSAYHTGDHYETFLQFWGP